MGFEGQKFGDGRKYFWFQVRFRGLGTKNISCLFTGYVSRELTNCKSVNQLCIYCNFL